MEQYRLKSLEIENFKGMRCFSYEAKTKRLTIVRGPNGAGKSSVLQAVATLLIGDKASPVHPITDGESDASVIGCLVGTSGDTLRITHRWATDQEGKARHTLAVDRITPQGELAVKKPQSAIDELIDTITLDPAVFFRTASAERRTELIQRAANLDIYKLSKMACEIQRAEDERKKAKAETLQAEAAANSLGKLLGPDVLYVEEASRRLKEAQDDLDCATKSEERRRILAAEIKFEETRAIERQIALDDAKKLVAQLERDMHNGRQSFEELKVSFAELPSCDESGIADYKSRVADWQRQLAASQQRQKLETQLADAQEKANEFGTAENRANAAVGQLRIERRKYIDAGLESAGLSDCFGIDDDGKILVFGVPAEDASESERMRASARCAMATKPGVRVLLLDNADSLGPDAIAEVNAIAEKNDFQVIMAGVWLQTDVADTIELEEYDQTS